MLDKLPDKIIDIDIVRANWNFKKRCTCQDRTFVLDPQNREVHCGQCGVVVDAFDALMELANHYERINNQLHAAYEQRKQIINYKPWLLAIRDLEKQYRGYKMLPECPRCREPFYLEELSTWTSREFGDARIKDYKKTHPKE